MIIACPSCKTRFEVNAAVFPAAGRKVKCARCAHIWHAKGEPGGEAPVAGPVAEVEPVAAIVAPVAAIHHDKPAVAADIPPEMVWANAELPQRRSRMATLGIVAAVLTVTAFCLVQFRQSVVAFLPMTGPAYAAVGLPVDTVGLDLKIEAHAMNDTAHDGASTLVVTGSIANVTTEERPVPRIRATLFDKDQKELHSWTFDAGIASLKPGESHDFRQVLAQPPTETYQVYAHFADASE
ncbi:hypothetical protein sos41_08550 [Alphaproteobacteria bacterium SO-S41]|nr:hypothetical protein sos41_08550 [Alphaproteobacteria bacterium SO-S41]